MVAKKKYKIKVFALFLVFLISIFAMDVSAENDAKSNEGKGQIKLECYDEYKEMLDALPKEISDLLPEELYSDNADEIAKGAKKITSFGYILKSALELVGIEIYKSAGLFSTLLGVVILSAVMNSVKTSFSSSKIGEIFSCCTSCLAFIIGISYLYSVILSVKKFFSMISLLTNSMIPLMCAMYAMGGNVSSAVVSNGSLMLFLNILDNFCAKTAIFVAGICIAFASVGTIMPDVSMGGISASFKRIYTTVLAFVMSVFSTVMATQNLIANKADSIASKGVKFAVSNLVPVVGSAIAGTLGTVSTGIEYLRASVGTVGIILVLLLLLPTAINLIITKFAFSSVCCVSDILDCGREKKLFDEFVTVSGLLLGCVCICSVCLIFMLVMFVRCTSSIGGTI